MATLGDELTQRVKAVVEQLKSEVIAAGLDAGLVDEISVTETGQGVKVSFFATQAAKSTDVYLLNGKVQRRQAVTRATVVPLDPDTLPLIGKDGHLIESDDGDA